ncbi:hypothetical protein Smlt3778 [Stenotrophomonas maltophilia K279a]|uniref:Uncharacterized protein n=1 Tax=Stenotrophomonas maltophilia (strain K279a) TaxID=522373 RepID=B2FSD3_STRMK|nr:hypothetical protein Smlt3778 [Stenotrophomonas maltophilia K279a]
MRQPVCEPRFAPTGSMGIHINGYPEIHPRMAWIYGVDQVDSYQSEIGADQRSAPTTSRVKLSKAGWVRLRGCPRHGCRGQAPTDGFTASPATGPTPPSHGMHALAVDVAGQRPALPGCRAQPCQQTPTLRTSG